MSTLKEKAQRFNVRLQAIKKETPLEPNLAWYPWSSLGQFDVLDQFFRGDTDEFLRMTGSDPVLDVGCGDGDVAFFLQSLGASVDVVDNARTNYNAMYGVRALKRKLSSSGNIYPIDIDSGSPLPTGPYGFAVLLGILYHLKNPYLILESLAHSSRYVFLSTRIAEWSPDRKTSFAGNPTAYLVGEDELNQDATNYWIFTEVGLKRIVRRAGWDILHYQTTGPVASSDPVSPTGDARAYILAKSRLAAAVGDFRRTAGWHEIEHGVWQWTAKRFSIETTLQESRPSAKLRFRFHLPDPVFAATLSVTLSARLASDPSAILPELTCTHPGEHEYVVDLPALNTGMLHIDFELSNAIPPSLADRRELGLQVNLAGVPPIVLT